MRLLEFGLAKAFTAQREASPSIGENSPTLTGLATLGCEQLKEGGLGMTRRLALLLPLAAMASAAHAQQILTNGAGLTFP